MDFEGMEQLGICVTGCEIEQLARESLLQTLSHKSPFLAVQLWSSHGLSLGHPTTATAALRPLPDDVRERDGLTMALLLYDCCKHEHYKGAL